MAALSVSASIAFAQQEMISGTITDAVENIPVAFAHVILMKSDSTFVTGVSTDMDGKFEIGKTAQAGDLLSVTYMGYEKNCFELDSMSGSTLNVLLYPSSVHLDEITIQARSVILKEDRKVVLPTQEQIRTATDGVDMLRKLRLSRLMVDVVSGEISMSGNGEIQLRINGVQVTSADIASIPPEDILRIEYHDQPGARYGKADAVIDYITRRKETGGNVNASVVNGTGKKRVSHQDRISLKYNQGKSELTGQFTFIQRRQYWTREYDEKLIFPDREIHRIENSEPALFNKKIFNTTLNYSFQEKDKCFFNAQLSFNKNDFPNSYEDRNSKLYTSDSETPVSIYDHTEEISNSPALDLYYQHHLQNNQLLILNVVGTYIGTKSQRVYHEKRDELFDIDLLSDIRGNRYSLIAEGIYEKKTTAGKITAGIRHLQAYTNNEYKGTITADVSLCQSESAVYAEYQQKIGKIGYMANLTGVRLYYSQEDHQIQKYALEPALRLTYDPNSNSFLRYRVHLRNIPPSLATMNNVEQRIDTWQLRRGNPDLSAFTMLGQHFTAGYNKKRWEVELLVRYDHEFDPIMESVFYEDGVFVRRYENQKSFQEVSAEATIRVKPWKEHLSLSITPAVTHFISTGLDYHHTYTMSELRVDLDFSYNNWIAGFNTITPPRFMYGEHMTKSDQMYTLTAGYKQSNWSLMIGGMNLFTREYRAQNKNWAAVNPVNSEIHSSNNNKSFVIKFSINLNYGKQMKSNKKRIHHMDTDTGLMQGVKN